MAWLLSLSALCLGKDAVGHVLMVAGDASRVSATGEETSLGQGVGIYVGDTITTAEASMLQLKMIDEALLILQAGSQLVIEAYSYSPESPKDQAAKLTLNKGRLRSITGKLGESNHDAFRLNTPIAAIGIRGTDFEISTDAEVTRVRLNSGAIVFSPFSDACLPEALGPCQSDNALLLSEELGSPVAELRANDTAPRLMSIDEFDPQATNGDRAAEDGLLTERRADDVEDSVTGPGGGSPGSGGGSGAPGVELPEGEADKIHWGKWGSVTLDGIPDAADVRGPDKETLFTNDVFILYRDSDFSRLGNDSVNFMLYEAQAVLVGPDRQYQTATVAGGSLFVDFAGGTFTTDLSVNSAPTGRLGLSASGVVTGSGLFASQSGNMNVLGGFSDQGTQAGYLFDHNLANELKLQGATQWVRP